MLRVGLTGGIACGKSHVLRRLSAAGLVVMDLDRLAHEAMGPGGAAYDAVEAAFGSGILAEDGSIDRKALGAIVFADAAARDRLNALVHPRVRAEEARRAAAFEGSPEAVVVTDAALLVESGVHLRFDRLVVVHCSPEAQLERLMRRDGIGLADAQARIAAQMPISEKRRFGHLEVDTSGTVEDTDRAADALAVELQRLAPLRQPSRGVPLRRALGSLVHGPKRGPRGLTPFGVLEEIRKSRGPELERLAGLLDPPATGPWYRAARADEPGPPPAGLVAPLVLWALARGAPDPPFLCAAAASLARLTHLEPRAVADTCFQSLVLQDAVALGEIGQDRSEWRRLAGRWSGVPPSPSAELVWEAAQPGRADVAAARDAARRIGADADLAGMIAGALRGVSEQEAGSDRVEAVKALAL